MTLEKLRSNEEIVKKWASTFNSKIFQDGVWRMLQTQHPLRYSDPYPVTTASAEKRLGMIEGYELALERLRLCAQYTEQAGEMPVATFADPEPPEE